MEIFIFLIPFVVAAFLLIFFRKQTTWWEYAVLIVPSILIGILMEFVFKQSNAADTEYLGSYVTRIRHYDAWNEYIHRTCTRTVGSGKHQRTETYDCSYVDNHPERWTYFDARNKEEYFMTDNEFNVVRKILGTKSVFIDMHRDYYTKDGDAQEWAWDGSIENSYTHSLFRKSRLCADGCAIAIAHRSQTATGKKMSCFLMLDVLCRILRAAPISKTC